MPFLFIFSSHLWFAFNLLFNLKIKATEQTAVITTIQYTNNNNNNDQTKNYPDTDKYLYFYRIFCCCLFAHFQMKSYKFNRQLYYTVYFRFSSLRFRLFY